MASIFIGFKHLNWMKLWVVVAGTAVFWAGMAPLIPAKWHTPVLVILSSMQSGFTFIMRASKYVESRNEVPPPGVQP